MQASYFETMPFQAGTGDYEEREPAFEDRPPSWWDRFLDKVAAWLSRSSCTDEEDYWTALMLMQ